MISQLRAVVEPRRPPRAPATHLISSSAGYALRASDDSVDVVVLRSRGAACARRFAAGVCHVKRRRPSLGGRACLTPTVQRTDLVQAEVARLLQLRLAMIEARAARVAAPGPPRADRRQASSQNWSSNTPSASACGRQLAISQFQTLRQADALATLRTRGRTTGRRAGRGPLPSSRTLEFAILDQSPELTAPPAVPLTTEPRPSTECPGDPARVDRADHRTRHHDRRDRPAPCGSWGIHDHLRRCRDRQVSAGGCGDHVRDQARGRRRSRALS